jgi:glycerate 2-kinase
VKDLLRSVFAATLRELDVTASMPAAIETVRIETGADGKALVLAYGKAARGMTRELVRGLPGVRWRGLVVTPAPDDEPLPPFEVIAAGHPLPDANSLRAGQRALELARGVERDEVVVFLASGGGSALLEWPIDGMASLDEVRRLYRALVGSGADIVTVNTVRKHLSAVKAGRLALAAGRARTHVTLLLSDVPDRELAEIASGPSFVDESVPADCRRALDAHRLWPHVPPRLAERLRREDLPPRFTNDALGVTAPLIVQYEEIGSNRTARAVASRALREQCVQVVDDMATDDWPYQRAATHLVHRLERLRRRWPGRRVAVIAGGELSVPLPHDPGTGGRNQQFVLACARLIRGRPITVLSAGTDGVDGDSPAAGALADGHTMARARAIGLDVHAALRRCDAFPLLDALHDTIVTGPTGTNVRDLRILVHHG